jgi:hypothetical protein
VGVTVGAAVGVAVGAEVGVSVGADVGLKLGVFVGAIVGVRIGFAVGSGFFRVGAVVGVAVIPPAPIYIYREMFIKIL